MKLESRVQWGNVWLVIEKGVCGAEVWPGNLEDRNNNRWGRLGRKWHELQWVDGVKINTQTLKKTWQWLTPSPCSTWQLVLWAMTLACLSVSLSPESCTLSWLNLALSKFDWEVWVVAMQLKKRKYIYPELALVFFIIYYILLNWTVVFWWYVQRNSKVLDIPKDLGYRKYLPSLEVWVLHMCKDWN